MVGFLLVAAAGSGSAAAFDDDGTTVTIQTIERSLGGEIPGTPLREIISDRRIVTLGADGDTPLASFSRIFRFPLSRLAATPLDGMPGISMITRLKTEAGASAAPPGRSRAHVRLFYKRPGLARELIEKRTRSYSSNGVAASSIPFEPSGPIGADDEIIVAVQLGSESPLPDRQAVTLEVAWGIAGSPIVRSTLTATTFFDEEVLTPNELGYGDDFFGDGDTDRTIRASETTRFRSEGKTFPSRFSRTARLPLQRLANADIDSDRLEISVRSSIINALLPRAGNDAAGDKPVAEVTVWHRRHSGGRVLLGTFRFTYGKHPEFLFAHQLDRTRRVSRPASIAAEDTLEVKIEISGGTKVVDQSAVEHTTAWAARSSND